MAHVALVRRDQQVVDALGEHVVEVGEFHAVPQVDVIGPEPPDRLRIGDAREGLLEIADTGRGVAEEDRRRLFERFYRSDRARASRGTGLGLAIVKHVVTAAGGEVEATGGLGHGLRVTCRFPMSAQS